LCPLLLLLLVPLLPLLRHGTLRAHQQEDMAQGVSSQQLLGRRMLVCRFGVGGR
jgi:hypothetical protein